MIRDLNPRVLWLAAFAAAFVFGFAVRSASADHYHTCCGSPEATGHALVHGGSTSDNVWHGRSTNNDVLAVRYCAAGSEGGGQKGYDTAGAGSTCEILVIGNGGIYHDQECYSWGYEDKGLSYTTAHYHYHHNICGNVAIYP